MRWPRSIWNWSSVRAPKAQPSPSKIFSDGALNHTPAGFFTTEATQGIIINGDQIDRLLQRQITEGNFNVLRSRTERQRSHPRRPVPANVVRNHRYSTENQRNAIAEYAQLHGYEVVASYVDAGKKWVVPKREGCPPAASQRCSGLKTIIRR